MSESKDFAEFGVTRDIHETTVYQRAQDGMMQLAIDSAVKRAVAEARADEARRCAADVCCMCGEDASEYKSPELRKGHWMHPWIDGKGWTRCAAGPIHERLHRESQKGGNHEKAETQTGAD